MQKKTFFITSRGFLLTIFYNSFYIFLFFIIDLYLFTSSSFLFAIFASNVLFIVTISSFLFIIFKEFKSI